MPAPCPPSSWQWSRPSHRRSRGTQRPPHDTEPGSAAHGASSGGGVDTCGEHPGGSSEPSSQSASPSQYSARSRHSAESRHRNVSGAHSHCRSSSPATHCATPSHRAPRGTHAPSSQRYSSREQFPPESVRARQCSVSSEPSIQSARPSQRQEAGIQTRTKAPVLLPHANCVSPQPDTAVSITLVSDAALSVSTVNV